jgi:hypothetical protein
MSCRHEWTGETVQDAPVGVFIASMKAVRCPSCYRDWRRIAMITEPSRDDTAG